MDGIPKSTQESFIAGMTEPALAARDAWGIIPSLLVAQACLESAYGTKLPAPHNYVGIKDLAFDRGGVNALTHDDPHRQGPARPARFEDFRNATHCFLQYGRLLMRSPSYKAYRRALSDPAAAARALQGTYSTDANYAEELMRVWGEHDLGRIDKMDGPPGGKAEPGTGMGTGTGTEAKAA
jgi:flagellar protein FlgJ